MFARGIFFISTLFFAGLAYADSQPGSGTSAPASAPATPEPTETLPTTYQAHDENTYIEVTWPDLLRSMVRFNAIDLHDENLIDEYAAVTDCEIYKFYYKDDFKWNEIRKKIRDSVDMDMAKYPAHFYFYTVLRLDRYDFDKKIYRFTDSTAIKDVNIFPLYEATGPMCDGHLAQYIPSVFKGIADAPFTMMGLPLTPADAQAILRQMDADKNSRHTIVAKFNMTVTYIDHLTKTSTGSGNAPKKTAYVQSLDHPAPPGLARIDVHLDSVNFYEDGRAMTKLVYTAKP